MKKRYAVYIVLFFIIISPSLAAIRTEQQAAIIAGQAISQQKSCTDMPYKSLAPMNDKMTLVLTLYKTNTCSHNTDRKTPAINHLQQPALYVFNSANDGFAVISADERTPSVLCVSEKGKIDTGEISPAFSWWLERFAEEISTLNDSISLRSEVDMQTSVEPISPLLDNIAWGQTKPFNNFCPIDNADNTRCYTGCVATAAAQIMYFWKYPDNGKGSHSYTWYNYDPDSYNTTSGTYTSVIRKLTLSADFSQTQYRWDDMLPSYHSGYNTNQVKAVATLMSHLGIACNMDYGGVKRGASSSYMLYIASALVSYFDYTLDKYYDQYYLNTKTDAFISAFNQDLEAGRPILVRGSDASGAGHAFVCDGRNANGYFHINWGWEGIGNCYTLLTSLKPSNTSSQYNKQLAALIGLRPKNIQEPCHTVYTIDSLIIKKTQFPYSWHNHIVDKPDTIIVDTLTSVLGCDSLCVLYIDTVPTSGICGDKMYWKCDEPYKQLTITGEGEMYNYDGNKSPWRYYKNDIDTIVFENIGNGIISIGNEAFSDLSLVSSFVLPQTLQSVGTFAFYSCVSLKHIHLPATLQKLGGGAFAFCENMTSVVLSDYLSSIEDFTFYGCVVLQDIDMPANISYIGSEAFADCISLQHIVSRAQTPPSVEKDAFDNVDRSTVLYIPQQADLLYSQADVWQEFIRMPLNEEDENDITTGIISSDYRLPLYIVKPIFVNGMLYIRTPDGIRYTVSGIRVE